MFSDDDPWVGRVYVYENACEAYLVVHDFHPAEPEDGQIQVLDLLYPLEALLEFRKKYLGHLHRRS